MFLISDCKTSQPPVFFENQVKRLNQTLSKAKKPATPTTANGKFKVVHPNPPKKIHDGFVGDKHFAKKKRCPSVYQEFSELGEVLFEWIEVLVPVRQRVVPGISIS